MVADLDFRNCLDAGQCGGFHRRSCGGARAEIGLVILRNLAPDSPDLYNSLREREGKAMGGVNTRRTC